MLLHHAGEGHLWSESNLGVQPDEEKGHRHTSARHRQVHTYQHLLKYLVHNFYVDFPNYTIVCFWPSSRCMNTTAAREKDEHVVVLVLLFSMLL